MKLSNIKNTQPVIFVLVGLPGSGKSTWMRNIMQGGNYVVVSSDDEIEKYARDNNSTYSEVFNSYVKTATTLMNQKFKAAVESKSDIIWDQTNMSAKKRRTILQQVPKNYKKVAVVFQIDRQELQRRLDKRAADEGKHIPAHIIDSMERTFEMPTVGEGFNEIIRV
jgi:predicted kinase